MCPRSNVKSNLTGEVRLGLTIILKGINFVLSMYRQLYSVLCYLIVLFRKDDLNNIFFVWLSLGYC